jgi:radical SAM superfamily enzyme YgiQ (UPF0313 family)
MKINLILANGEHDPFQKQYPFMPLVLPILASCAPEHEYTFTDLLWDDISSVDFEGDYDLIGISFRVSATKTAYKIADRFRERNKTVIMGGPQVSSVPLKAKEHADSIVIGEAEFLWPRLLEDFQNNRLRDFYLSSPRPDLKLDGYSIYVTDCFPDISKLPAPIRSGFKTKYTFDMVFAARGCPLNCHFCAVSTLFGQKMRFKNIPDVIAEISKLRKKFFLLDDNIFGRNDSYDYYLQLYTEMLKLPGKRYWTGQANLNAAASDKGQEVIRQASRSGLTYAAIGFESMNAHDLKKLEIAPKMGIKDISNHVGEISRNVRFIQNQGIAASAWFTIGLEHDTYESIEQTISFCIQHQIFPVLTPIQALEGTRFHSDLKQNNKLIDQTTNVSNARISVLTNEQFIMLLETNLFKAYSFRVLLKNSWFYFKKTLALRRSFHETVYRTIFIIITQIRMKKFLKKDVIRFKMRIRK